MKNIEVLEEIYLNPGIHLRELSRKLKLGIPAVKNHLEKLMKEGIITRIKEGRNVKFFPNFKSRKIIAYLSEIELTRLGRLPRVIGNAIFDLLSALETKPLLTIIFGSYARGDYTEESDLDILLVFNELSKEIELKARLISERYSVRIQPVYLLWKEFKEKFFNVRDAFMSEIKRNKIIVNGIIYWVMLENEKA